MRAWLRGCNFREVSFLPSRIISTRNYIVGPYNLRYEEFVSGNVLTWINCKSWVPFSTFRFFSLVMHSYSQMANICGRILSQIMVKRGARAQFVGIKEEIISAATLEWIYFSRRLGPVYPGILYCPFRTNPTWGWTTRRSKLHANTF